MSNTPLKLTPFYGIAQRLNAQFAEYNNWKMPEVYTTREAEMDAARSRVVLVDETPNGKFTVECRQVSSAAEATSHDSGEKIVLNTVFSHFRSADALNPQSGGQPPTLTLAINAGTVVGSIRVYRLRHDLFFISTPPDEVVAMEEKLTAGAKASAQRLTVTDVTHGRAEIRVIGPSSQNLLSQLCGLNFQAATFPNGAAKQGSLAKTTQLIIRRDIGALPAFSIIGARSMGAYIWETLMEAGREWGLVPMGCAALNMLEGGK